MTAKQQISIEEYLRKLAGSVDDSYGRQIRQRFRDIRGSSELAMLAAPSSEELEQLKKAVAIMTKEEKQNPCDLTDEQIQNIASDAGVDPGNLAIFINGYCLRNKRGNA
jgi:cell division protein ZapA (FtsZ GTPase activity inhibitor)